MTSFWTAVNAMASVVMAFAAAYFFSAIALGLREVRRARAGRSFQADLRYGRPFERMNRDGAPMVYFLVACLNEAAVIANTVEGLADPVGDVRTVVVDDGSDDATGDIAAVFGGSTTTVIRRELPDARKGKGAALNAGFTHIVADVAVRGLDPRDVLICVMDADGRLSDGALAEVLPIFADPKVGGVQLPVRIRNRTTNFLLRFQDYQFWTQSAITQFGRMRTDSVSLGGNGQFTRLSALLELGAQPWSTALTEDLDLTISLAIRGWRTSSTPRAAVDQQGLEKVRPLIRQRTRWYQGHMMAGRRLPDVLASQELSAASAIEIALYLAVPWVLDLPWSILFHLILAEIITLTPTVIAAHQSFGHLAPSLILAYVLCFWPANITAVIAKQRDPELSWATALRLGHSFVLMNYLSYICVWRALFRIVRGQKSWTKTARVIEAPRDPRRHLTAGASR